MSGLLTSAQMRAIEQAAIAGGAASGLDLMQRAGAGVVAACLAEWPELALTAHRALVLCGPGNNGGDGFVVARLLKERGWEVAAWLLGDAPMPATAEARLCARAYLDLFGAGEAERRHLLKPAGQARGFAAPDLLVDAVFGTGLKRPLSDADARIIGEALGAGRPARIVAVDLPSGYCSDSGRRLGSGRDLLRPDLTVTFHRPKVGAYLADQAEAAGKLIVTPIGLDEATPVAGPVVTLLDGQALDIGRLAKLHGHKYSHGHAVVLSGPASRTGAARLAARGALRIGAGLVSVAAPKAALAEHAARLDAIMLREVDGPADLAGLLGDPRINALCLGPGLGTDARAGALVAEALRIAGDSGAAPAPEPGPRRTDAAPATSGFRVKPGTAAARSGALRANPLALVLDADALTLLARDAALMAALPAACVLTPHAGEFARLFPDIAARLAAPASRGPAFSKVDATREAARRAGCVVLFKGADTVIADPQGHAAINSAAYDRAAPWLATAGSGDVLAGMIAGLLARGFTAISAAGTAAWLHVEAARSFGPGLVAEDLPEELPKVFRALLA